MLHNSLPRSRGTTPSERRGGAPQRTEIHIDKVSTKICGYNFQLPGPHRAYSGKLFFHLPFCVLHFPLLPKSQYRFDPLPQRTMTHIFYNTTFILQLSPFLTIGGKIATTKVRGPINNAAINHLISFLPFSIAICLETVPKNSQENIQPKTVIIKTSI